MKRCKVSCHTDDILHHIGVKLHYLGATMYVTPLKSNVTLVQSYVTPHIEGKRYTNIFCVKLHFFFTVLAHINMVF